MTEEDRVRLRHTDRWVGALVLLAILAFGVALFQRSVIREWFASGSELIVLLPEEGVRRSLIWYSHNRTAEAA